MLSTYSPFLSISVKLVSFDFRCFIIIAWRINDEQVAPKRTTLKRYVTSGLKGSVGSSNQKNLVTSLSLLCNFICRKAFSISVVTAYGFNLNLVKIQFQLSHSWLVERTLGNRSGWLCLITGGNYSQI